MDQTAAKNCICDFAHHTQTVILVSQHVSDNSSISNRQNTFQFLTFYNFDILKFLTTTWTRGLKSYLSITANKFPSPSQGFLVKWLIWKTWIWELYSISQLTNLLMVWCDEEVKSNWKQCPLHPLGSCDAAREP